MAEPSSTDLRLLRGTRWAHWLRRARSPYDPVRLRAPASPSPPSGAARYGADRSTGVGRSGGALGRGLVRFTALGALLGAALIVVPAWCVRTVSAGRMKSVDDVPAQPVALVLGAEVYADGRPSRYLRARLDVARELFSAGKIDAILVSGDGTPHYDETGGMRNYLIAHGVPADRIAGDYAGFDTYDSCVRAKRVFGATNMILVSQTYHLPRALTICRAIGLDAWGVGDDTVRSSQEMWSYGTLRELGANLKMVWDLLSRRQPVLEPHDDSLDRALRP